MSERSPTRRSLLKGATAAALLTVPAITLASEADPLQSLVTAYRDECARLNAIPGDIPDDTPMPVWHVLNGDAIPAATTKEGAMSALQLAIDLHEDFASVDAVPNLMQAALGFLEGGIS
ncbi:twin-arginine translocation signal domain-containing protein [Xanthobacter autotrophicus]|uniref:twin-arginine translocation signal domain-containing protein n=1 Tax=Xanthobacter autotrophicus TaxID=280 RepID=UPI00372C890D